MSLLNKVLRTEGDQKLVGKRLRIGQDYNTETSGTRNELTFPSFCRKLNET